MIQRFLRFLGPGRSRALFAVISVTGTASLILNAMLDAGDWVRPAQSLLALAAAIGTVIIIGGRMDPQDRARWLAVLAPSIGALLLAAFFLPQYTGLLAGAALGWIVAGLFIFRSRAPMAYQRAVKRLRKDDYAEAVRELDALIKQEPNKPNHYAFRAQVLRLWGKLDRAHRDYLKMIEIAPDSAQAFNGLAEVSLQSGDYRSALEAAYKAAELAPSDWVAYYNLGMIEDRLGQSAGVIEHLDRALAVKVRDTRHRALMQLYRARAFSRMGDADAARAAVAALKRDRVGVEEWSKIMESEQAATLNQVLGADIKLAEKLVTGEIDVMILAGDPSR